MASSSTAGVLPPAVERAVVSKGRLSTSSLSSPLILLHAAEPPSSSSSSSSSHKAQAFARHACFLYHHLLGKLRNSSRYRGVVLVGLEDLPRIMHQADDGQEGVLAALDGFALPPTTEDDDNNMRVVLPLDTSSAEAFVESVRRALPAQQSSSPSTPSRRSSSKKEDKEEEEQGEEEEEADLDEDGQQDIALGIDSLNMLAHQLKSMPVTVMALRKLLLHSSSSSSNSNGPSLSPLLAVLHSEGTNRHSILSKTWRLALEDLATTNVYLYPQGAVSGRCLVIRKSASGKVHEEWESYSIDINDGTVHFAPFSSTTAAVSSTEKESTKAGTTVAMTPANGSSSSSKKEAAFLESLPFRISLTEQERAMRGQVVLPHERQRNEGGQTNLIQQQPLLYHEVEGGDDEEDDEEEEDDDDIDDDLDL